MTVTVVTPAWGNGPMHAECPNCRQTVITKTKDEAGTFAWLMCVALCFIWWAHLLWSILNHLAPNQSLHPLLMSWQVIDWSIWPWFIIMIDWLVFKAVAWPGYHSAPNVHKTCHIIVQIVTHFLAWANGFRTTSKMAALLWSSSSVSYLVIFNCKANQMAESHNIMYISIDRPITVYIWHCVIITIEWCEKLNYGGMQSIDHH